MFSRLLFSAAFGLTACAQNAAAQVEVANLREDVRGLVQRVGDLSLRVEQLELENSALRRKSKEGVRAYATLAQLNEAVADLNRMVKSAVSTSQDETLLIVRTQLEKLGRQTNAALDSLAKSQGGRSNQIPATPPDASVKDGGSYLVQKGDTLALIAKKTGAKQQDIVSANKISDPSLIKVGQTLIIPTAK